MVPDQPFSKSPCHGNNNGPPCSLDKTASQLSTTSPSSNLTCGQSSNPYIALVLCDEVSRDIQKLQQAGIIKPVNASPWISNLVVAKKKSGGLRMSVDLRAVNKAVIPDKYPLPTIKELTTHFYGSTTFSKLDLRQGYLKVPLHPDSHNLTAFVTHTGVYTRMPFGLSCFQKIMSTIFTGIPGVVIYLDDIVVHGSMPALHAEHLRRVLSILAEHNLTLNEQKCVFSMTV